MLKPGFLTSMRWEGECDVRVSWCMMLIKCISCCHPTVRPYYSADWALPKTSSLYRSYVTLEWPWVQHLRCTALGLASIWRPCGGKSCSKTPGSICVNKYRLINPATLPRYILISLMSAHLQCATAASRCPAKCPCASLCSYFHNWRLSLFS